MSEKRYTPKEAALAVLKRASELYKAHTLAKAEDPLNPIAGERIKRAAGYKERGDEVGNKIAMDGAKDSHKERLEGIKSQPKPNLDKAEEAPMKGHIKLAKFMGAMEAKRGSRPGKAPELDKAETGHEKGIHTKSPDFAQGSKAGNKLAVWPKSDASKSPLMGQLVNEAHGEAKDEHKRVLGEMKSQPKPKLPG